MVHIQFHFLLSGFYDCVKPDCLNAVSVRKGEWKMIFKHGLRQPVLFLSTTIKQSGWYSSMDRILNMVCISLLLWGGPTKSFLNRIGSNSASPLPVLGTGHSPGHTVWSSCGHTVWSFDYFRPVGAFLCGLSFVSVGHKKVFNRRMHQPAERWPQPINWMIEMMRFSWKGRWLEKEWGEIFFEQILGNCEPIEGAIVDVWYAGPTPGANTHS